VARELKIRIAFGVLWALGLFLPLAFSATAQAESLLSTTVAAAEAVDRDCTDRALSGASVDSAPVTAPGLGSIEARLDAGSGDWDVAVLDAQTGRTVAGSAFAGSTEVAGGFVTEGQDLVVQACRRSGQATTADLRPRRPRQGHDAELLAA
jgi:hypothetical protein